MRTCWHAGENQGLLVIGTTKKDSSSFHFVRDLLFSLSYHLSGQIQNSSRFCSQRWHLCVCQQTLNKHVCVCVCNSSSIWFHPSKTRLGYAQLCSLSPINHILPTFPHTSSCRPYQYQHRNYVPVQQSDLLFLIHKTKEGGQVEDVRRKAGWKETYQKEQPSSVAFLKTQTTPLSPALCLQGSFPPNPSCSTTLSVLLLHYRYCYRCSLWQPSRPQAAMLLGGG